MADNTYQVGDVVPLQATFSNAAGVPTDTTVTLEIRDPGGTRTTPTPVHASAGVYTYSLTVDQPGLWWYAFIGTGAVAATEQNSFYVQARYTATGAYPLASYALLTLDEAREYVTGKPSDDSLDDKLIKRINEISAAVKAYTRREWLPVVTQTRRFYYRGAGIITLVNSDLQSLTSITAFTDYPTSYQQILAPGTTTTISDYRLGPSGGMPPNATYRWIDISSLWKWSVWQPPYYQGFEVTINGTWGIGVVPDDVKLAVKIALRDVVENPEGFASRTLGPLAINEPIEEAVPEARWRALPAEARALLSEYRDDSLVVAA